MHPIWQQCWHLYLQMQTLPHSVLKSLLKRNVETTFNAITVDGDTSTNDMVSIFSTGKAKNLKIENVLDPKLNNFEKSLHNVMLKFSKTNCCRWRGGKKIYNYKC